MHRALVADATRRRTTVRAADRRTQPAPVRTRSGPVPPEAARNGSPLVRRPGSAGVHARRAVLDAAAAALVLVGMAALPGCQGLQTAQVDTYQQQLLAQQRTNYELQQRINELNATNEEMNRLVGQSQQQVQMLQETNDALREQLRSTTEQVARLKSESDARQQRIEMLSASLQRRGGAIIEPNNSLQSELPALDLPGVDARRDGDTIRVAIPAALLFEEGASRLRADAGPVLERLADHLARIYPQQRIVIEGHVDRDPTQPPAGQTPHQLTLARAAVVFDYLVRHTRLMADQLSIAGHGANQPRYSNASEAGRQRNRRIELVVLPEKVDGRKP